MTDVEGVIEEADEGASEVLGMARAGALNLVGALFSQIAFFVITVLLARARAGAVGRYGEGFALLSLLGLLSFSAGSAPGSPGSSPSISPTATLFRRLRGTVRLGLGLSAGGAAVLGGALWVAAPWLAHHAFTDPRLTTVFRFVGLTLPASVFADAALSATQGYRTMKPYAYVGLLFDPRCASGSRRSPWPRTTGSAAPWSRSRSRTTARRDRGACSCAGSWAGSAERPRYEPRELFGFSAVSWLASLASTGLIWADTMHPRRLPLECRGGRVPGRHPAGDAGGIRDGAGERLRSPRGSPTCIAAAAPTAFAVRTRPPPAGSCGCRFRAPSSASPSATSCSNCSGSGSSPAPPSRSYSPWASSSTAPPAPAG